MSDSPQARWNKRNRDVVNAAVDKWRAANPEKVRDIARSWRQRNSDRVKENWIRNYADKKYYKEWRENNRLKARIVSQNRRKVVRNGKVVDKVSYDIIDRLLEEQDYECAHSLWWCKVDFLFNKFHLDHIIPLALGGKHEDGNLQLLCVNCNLSKGSKHPDDFILEEMRRRIKLRRKLK
jgi:5-methylcytosine-specific restriction endonuclease McrA